MTMLRSMLLLGAVALGAAGCAGRVPPSAPLRVAGNPTIELTPVHYAIAHGGARATAARGGIPALYDVSPASRADLAGHAETQALRQSLARPDLRIILTIAEGHYRIVARRSAGISSVADLRGRKVATPPESSAAYYLHRALETAGMSDADVAIVPVPMPPKDIAALLRDGKADAVALWEAEPQLAIEQLGDDAVILDPDTGYRELYNLNATAAQLADPASRARIVRFVAGLIRASQAMAEDPSRAVALAAQGTGYPAEVIRATWGHHGFPATLAPDLLDTLAAEEAWLARHQRRAARSRAELAALIDPSIEAEARAWLRNGER